MTLRIFRRLYDAQSAHRMLLDAWAQLKPYLMAGHRFDLSIKPETRNEAQNALLHALLGEIAAQVEWAGKRWDIDDWKRLLTAAWMRTQNQQALMVPAVDGHGFEVLYRRTSTLTKGECAELIDFITAWAVDKGVRLEQPEPTT